MATITMECRAGESFAIRFIRVQRLRGLTGAELARRMDCTPDLITYIRQGRTQPAYGTLMKVAKTLNVSVDWLMGLTDEFKELKGEEK